MSEQEPSMRLTLPGNKEFIMTPRNSGLYTFLGRVTINDEEIDSASMNHVFLQTGQNEQGQATGMYIFRMFHHAYPELSQFMSENKFPMTLNQRHIPKCDIDNYTTELNAQQAQFASQIPDFPED